MVKSVGGLATGMNSYLNAKQMKNYVWVGWPGTEFEGRSERRSMERQAAALNLKPVLLDRDTVKGFYNGFCNRTIYPLFHYFMNYASYDEEYWAAYKKANVAFSEAVEGILQSGDVVWVHDYHLMLLPALLRERHPDIKIGFFLHIPFPSFEIFRVLPHAWRTDILKGLLGSDLIGFHTYEYTNHFLTSVTRTLGHDVEFGYVYDGSGRLKRADTFPMGIDYKRFSEAATAPDVVEDATEIRSALPKDLKIILSMDRLDYTKGIYNRLLGYEEFLAANREMHGKVVLMLVAVPSREEIKEYQKLRQSIDELVGRINGKFGYIGWAPVLYQYKSIPSKRLSALYGISDVALITPLRDGMNLIAKEYVASKSNGDGVLILSEMAGAAKELNEAIIVNPYQPNEIAHAIESALKMPLGEQQRRMKAMQERLKIYDIARWGDEFLNGMTEISERQKVFDAKLPGREVKKLVAAYRKARRPILLLDYDGTLVSYSKDFNKAAPPAEIISMLKSLSSVSKNKVVLLSGRSKETLTKWFSTAGISLVAEHGAMIKEKGGDWKPTRPLTVDWKERVMPILKTYTYRLPGSSIEEKEFTLVWHYRAAEPEFADLRAAEMAYNLRKFTNNMDVQVSTGNKIIEIKNAGVNKGLAATYFINKYKPDFILAVGDDTTDEDTFKSLPKYAYTFRVGMVQSYARFNLRRSADVVRLLGKILKSGKA